jgi:hypothetical protein
MSSLFSPLISPETADSSTVNGNAANPTTLDPIAMDDLSSMLRLEVTKLQDEFTAYRTHNERVRDNMCEVIAWLMQEEVGPKNKVPPEIFETIRSIARTVKSTPSDALKSLVKDLQLANAARAAHQEQLQTLVGKQDFAGPSKVLAPPLKVDLRLRWLRLRTSLKDATNYEEYPKDIGPPSFAGSILLGRLDYLVSANTGRLQEPLSWINSLKSHCKLSNPITAQNLMAIILCQQLFPQSETMCGVENWRAAVGLYKTVDSMRITSR